MIKSLRIASAWMLGTCLQARPVRAQEAEYGAAARVQAESAVGATSLSSEEAVARPGALGEPARAALDTQGAARTGFLGSELVLWGAAPSESQSYVDGVEIPKLFHPTGLRTTLHPALVARVTVTPGALAAEYGRALGGALDVDTVKIAPGFAASLRSDGIDSSIAATGGTATVRALAAARYGYFDRVLASLAPDSQGLLAVPSHQDGAARVEVRADADTQLSATWIGARDRVALATETGSQVRANRFHVGWLRLERRYDDAARVRVTPFFGCTARDESSTFYGVPLALETSELFYGLRADYTRSVQVWTLRLGIDTRASHQQTNRRGTLSLPAREGDIRVFGQAPIDEVDSDRVRTAIVNVAPWASMALRFRDFTLMPSLRLESFLLAVDRQLPALPETPAVGHDALSLFPEPRLMVGYRVLPWLDVEARTGLYHQAPRAGDLSASYGAPTLQPARAMQSALGLKLALPFAVAVDITGYTKSLNQLAVRTEEAPPPLARQLVSRGRGSSHGLTLQAHRALARDLFFSASYTLSRSERSDARGTMRPFDYDQRHVLSALLGFARGAFVISLRLRTATGAPRTEVVGSYLDAKSGRAQPLFGPHNGVRLPTFVSLDLHAEYGIHVSPLALSIFADLLNATNQRNVEELAYDARYETRRDVTSIPIVGMVGLTVRVTRD